MPSLRKPRPEALDAIALAQQGEPLTYPEVGGTVGPLPDRYRHGRHGAVLGRGQAVFDRAAEGLGRWEEHRRARVDVRPAGAPPAVGLVVALAVGVGPVYVTAACRVVGVTDEPGRFGFAYGTLPHHVVEGEEAFLVTRDEQDVVRFEVVSFTRPRGRAMSLVGPLLHPLDERVVRRYLRGMEQYMAERA